MAQPGFRPGARTRFDMAEKWTLKRRPGRNFPAILLKRDGSPLLRPHYRRRKPRHLRKHRCSPAPFRSPRLARHRSPSDSHPVAPSPSRKTFAMHSTTHFTPPTARTSDLSRVRVPSWLVATVQQKNHPTMRDPKCPLCDDMLVEVEAALNRATWNVLLTSFGSSELQIRLEKKAWMPFMTPNRSARGLYCTKCGALTIAPSIPAHRRELGLDP